MTQDKAPEWAMSKAKTLVPDYVKRSIVENIALALSEAYERGQVDMRERAAKSAECAEIRVLDDKGGKAPVWGRTLIALTIRSLPIDSAGKDA